MRDYLQNPFNITKATDFSDQEINDYWVDIGDGDGFLNMAKPTSPMPMLILGGKGSGKTHLMRYFSYQLQRIRHSENIVSGITEEKYLGIYFRCGGLNAARFSGKGKDEETWISVFAYFMELWFAQLVLQIIADAFNKLEELHKYERPICEAIIDLFDEWDLDKPQNIKELIQSFGNLQKRINTAVNNCSLTRKLEINIIATSGKLTFGVPQVLASHLPSLKKLQFLYLVDEFENLAEPQQKYINSLLRERESPCTFKIGSRLYGIKTRSTFSADEENKVGSEYEILHLDSNFRKEKRKYIRFAMRLCARRLSEAGYNVEKINNCFEEFTRSRFAVEQTAYALQKRREDDRPYFKKLRRKLETGYKAGVKGVRSQEDIEEIIENLKVPKYPLLEKANIFLLYQDWYSGNNLLQSSKNIAKECGLYIRSHKIEERRHDVLSYFKNDLLAQLFRDCKQKQLYLGFGTFIEMSDGLPRNLLIILKHIFKWSVFYGEEPFTAARRISRDSQRSGVKEAAEWFYQDARIPGSAGEHVRDGIDRLATLFRDIRFADKPSECSISTFSTDLSKLSPAARQIIETSVNWSLLIKIEGGQRDRNSKRIDAKYQINSMLSPYWDLPISRRGALPLNSEEVNSIFDPNYSDRFESLKANRVERMRAPFFGKETKTNSSSIDSHRLLPGFSDD